jgi:hypothetical protein
LVLQHLDWKVSLPLGYKGSEKSVAREYFALRDAQGKVDQQVALEGIGLDNVGAPTI